MIRIDYEDGFVRSARKLPRPQQAKLATLLEILQENPFHQQLHTKSLVGKLSGLYSFRITRDWRVMFQFVSPDHVRLVDVGHRRDICRRWFTAAAGASRLFRRPPVGGLLAMTRGPHPALQKRPVACYTLA